MFTWTSALCCRDSPLRCISRWQLDNYFSIHGELIAYQHIRCTQTWVHLELFPVTQWINGFWLTFAVACMCVSLVLPISIWLCMCAKYNLLSLCDVWIEDDNPRLWMKSTERNLLCFLCAPQVHFLCSTI